GPKRGGTMTIAYKDDLATLDPAIGYDWTNWPAEKMVFDGLLDYDDTTNLVPQLAAEMPEISNNATVYTFKLRHGVKFHNGRELKAEDVVYSITRVLDPKTKSPGAGFFTGIKGAEDFIAGKTDHVEGIKALDDYTVQFTLSSPDVTFLNKLALNFAFIVPKEEVEKQGENFGHNPVGTGPFIFKEWIPGQRLVFVRNPNYFQKEYPYLDKVIIQVGITPNVQLLRLEKGDVDLMGDEIPSADFVRISQDPAWANRLVRQPQVSTIYIALNTRVKPFDDVRVRRAINHAINKKRIIKLLNGRGTVANQILPPLMPGYDPNYKGYEYNPEKAKQLLAEAGYPNGFSTFIECIAVDPHPKLCESFQQDLAQVGIKLEIKTLAASTVIEDGGTEGKAPMIWSGGLAWIQDYPDPDDFYGPILGCGSAVPGGWNWAWYCNKDLDAKAAAALAMTNREERLKVYREIFAKLMDEAVWVPVYNGQYNIAHSEHLHGKPTDFAHPEHTIRYERLWKD
ncbi:MAG: ABC transporter substrate-binding protein, partial [Anaerolineae bacterium]|nr:ABC transporter substrate-binding protein [Anaerolineae bacterium]